MDEWIMLTPQPEPWHSSVVMHTTHYGSYQLDYGGILEGRVQHYEHRGPIEVTVIELVAIPPVKELIEAASAILPPFYGMMCARLGHPDNWPHCDGKVRYERLKAALTAVAQSGTDISRGLDASI